MLDWSGALLVSLRSKKSRLSVEKQLAPSALFRQAVTSCNRLQFTGATWAHRSFDLAGFVLTELL